MGKSRSDSPDDSNKRIHPHHVFRGPVGVVLLFSRIVHIFKINWKTKWRFLYVSTIPCGTLIIIVALIMLDYKAKIEI